MQFITKEGKSCRIKGTVEYHKDDNLYTDMKAWMEPEYPAYGAAMVNV